MSGGGITWFEPFTAAGAWRVPEHPDRRVGGTVTFDPVGGIHLEVVGPLLPTPPNALMCFPGRQPVVYGDTPEPGAITLINVDSREIDSGLRTVGSELCRYTAQVLVTDAWLPPSGLAEITEVRAAIYPLDDAFSEPWSTLRNETLKDVGARRRTCCEAATPFGKLLVESGIASHRGRRLVLEPRAVFTMRPDLPKSLAWFEETLWDLRLFLNLVACEATHLSSLVAVLPGTNDKSGREPAVNVFRPVGVPLNAAPGSARDALLGVLDRHGRLREAIERWFGLPNDLKSVAALLTGGWYRDAPVEDLFLSLTQAAEGCHRIDFPEEGNFVPPIEYEPVRQALVDAIPTGTPHDLREALIQRLGFGNERSLRARLRDLVRRILIADDRVRTGITEDGWVSAVVSHRNALTHLSPGGERPPASSLLTESRQLALLLHLALLRDLGISFGEAAENLSFRRQHFGALLPR